MRWLLVAALVACSAPQTSSGPRTLEYTVLASGRPSGSGVVRIAADGTRRTRYAYNDRGRGPEIETELHVDKRGWPRRFRAAGLSYFKQPISEVIDTYGDEISWITTTERGAGRSGFYVVTYGDLDTSLPRALLRSPKRRLALAQGGEAWIESDAVVELDGRRLRQIAIGGLDLGPQIVWLDEDLELFARPSSWIATVRRGGEALLPRMLAADQALHARRSAQIATSLAKRPPAIAIVNATLFDPDQRTVTPVKTILVAGDKITGIGDVAVPPHAHVIDARGRMVIPGLWDMHTHLSAASDGLLLLANGITTVRDLGNDIVELDARVARYEAGSELGPRVLRAGIIEGPGPLAAPTNVLVATPEEARAAVDRYADRGCVQIKIYSSVKPELVPVIATRAKERGLRVSGHVPMGLTATAAVEAGFDELQHVNFLFLQFLAGPTDDTRTPLRFTRVAERAASLALDGPDVRAFLDLLAARRTVIDPTLAIFETIFTLSPGEPSPASAAWSHRLPVIVRRDTRSGGLPATPEQRATYKASFAALQRFVKLAFDRGIPIVAGTDAGAHTLARELELYVAAGIPAAEVLAMATLGAARVMGNDRESGSVTVGKQADLVLVDGDPTRDIGDVRNADVVIARGVLYLPDEMNTTLGITKR